MENRVTLITLVGMAVLAAVFAVGNWYFYFVPLSDLGVQSGDRRTTMTLVRVFGSVGLIVISAAAFLRARNSYAKVFRGILLIEGIAGVIWGFFGASVSEDAARFIGAMNATVMLIACVLLLIVHRSNNFTLIENC